MSRRRDAQRNRDLLIAAAEQEFREGGTSVALGRVADRAGVGRATLYRNFPDRQALVRAVYDRRLETVGVLVTAAASGDEGPAGSGVPGPAGSAGSSEPSVLPGSEAAAGTWAQRIERAVHAMVDFQLEVPGLLGVIQATPEGRQMLDGVVDRTLELFAVPLKEAQAEGSYAPHVVREDFLALFLLVEALIDGSPPGGARPRVARAQAIYLRGMRS